MYKTASICRNGHVIAIWGDASPDFNRKFCPDCGQPAVTACKNCREPIQGMRDGDWQEQFWKYPYFCFNCGQAYPWTADKLDAARELADELEGLDLDEREKLKATLPDLIAETPRSQVAALTAKRLIAKARGEARQAFVDVLRQVVRESIKAGLGL